MFTQFRKWKKGFDTRAHYASPSRLPFYELAKKHLPSQIDSIIVDIGPGEGDFAEYLGFKNTFPNHRLLDINTETVKQLSAKGFSAEQYRAPEKLPFADKSVAYVHLSHIVEHLPYQELYSFMKELNRVLDDGGILVISTPLLWDRFYEDLSHVKPYNPEVFINYLTRTKENATQSPVSTSFIIRDLQHRYRSVDSQEWGSRYFVIDTVMRIFRNVRSRLGFRKYIKNGYTIVLQKKLESLK